MVGKTQSEGGGTENVVDLFRKIGLEETTAKNTVANNKVTANLIAVIHEVLFLVMFTWVVFRVIEICRK